MSSSERSAPLRGYARAPFESSRGAELWRSLDELADSEAFRAYLRAEFPNLSHDADVDRRGFVKLMAASLALGGLGACAPPPEEIVPRVEADGTAHLGNPLFFATAMPLDGYGSGVLVESTMGRPTKVEGNPLHPASRGATDHFAQASVLQLWDPDRSMAVRHRDQTSAWSAFVAELNGVASRLADGGGAGLRILTGEISSPTLLAQLEALLDALPQARWHRHQPVDRANAAVASRAAFGENLSTHYHLDRADVVVALDADFLGKGPASVRYARDLAARNDADSQRDPARLYAVECTPSLTGAAADHRLRLRGRDVARFARRLASLTGLAAGGTEPLAPEEERFAAAVAADLARRRGRAIVIAGARQPPLVHVLAHALNDAFGRAGVTLTHTAPVTASSDAQASLEALVEAMTAGDVDTLLISEINPAMTSPANVDFAAALANVNLTLHHGLYRDETAELADWHVPSLHYLESWGDVRAFDGTATVLQPLIAPLYGGRSIHDVLGVLTGDDAPSAHDRVRSHWRGAHGEEDFEAFWSRALHDGVVPDSAFAARQARFDAQSLTAFETGTSETRADGVGNDDVLELVFAPDPNIWDGSFANNGWLQELPKPLTSLTWDNAALLSPATAKRLGVANEDVVQIRSGSRALEAPVWIVPGQADGSVTLHLGYGRRAAGRIGTGIGFDAYALRTSAEPWLDTGAMLRATGRRHALATTQHHHSMEGRNLVRRATLAEYRADPDFAAADREVLSTLYPEPAPGDYAWGMAIDLNRCIGCNACTIACQAENNIPIVGKEQVAIGREMHWIRVDTYFEGAAEAPRYHAQPVPCMHCEDAPCELVCPVGATLHDASGLNQQIYNRCIGTRFCSNNCPYKVRRFNFLEYSADPAPSLRAQRNPGVTVRSRGVMEKCTYCVQRITTARIGAEQRGEPLRDGEVVTACQAVCPTEAIVFGDIRDRESRVSAAKRSPRNYALLEEQNTRPRTTYLAKIRNANPELDG